MYNFLKKVIPFFRVRFLGQNNVVTLPLTTHCMTMNVFDELSETFYNYDNLAEIRYIVDSDNNVYNIIDNEDILYVVDLKTWEINDGC